MAWVRSCFASLPPSDVYMRVRPDMFFAAPVPRVVKAAAPRLVAPLKFGRFNDQFFAMSRALYNSWFVKWRPGGCCPEFELPPDALKALELVSLKACLARTPDTLACWDAPAPVVAAYHASGARRRQQQGASAAPPSRLYTCNATAAACEARPIRVCFG